MNYEKERLEIIETALKLKDNNLIKMSGGNVSYKIGDNTILVTPTAMEYETMKPEDIVVVNKDGDIIDGIRKPTSDLKAILYIFNHMENVKVVIHTHQPNAIALSLIADELPCISSTMVDELHGSVKVAPFTISSDIGMGIYTVDFSNNSLAVILKNHGVMAYGNSFDQALSAAIYLEESCAIYLKALGTHLPITSLTKKQIEEEDAPRGNYGQ